MYTICLFEVAFVFALGLALNAFVIPCISLVSFRKRLFDTIDARKIHQGFIPRLGGVSFFPCITISLCLTLTIHFLACDVNLLQDSATALQLLSICSCLFLLYLMGIMDDLIGVRYRSKFAIQIVCSVLIVASGLCFDNLYGLFGIYALPLWLGIPFTVFILVFILNAINLIDGIDGLASGLGAIAFLSLGCLFVSLRWWVYAFISFASLGVLVPFFYYNVFGQARRGRKIFMGDTGSLTIGLLLGVLVLKLSCTDVEKDSLIPGSILVAFSFLIVPLMDVIRVVIHRLRCGRSPFLPDKNHIHHKFMALGFTQRQSMVAIVCIALFFAFGNGWLIHYFSITPLLLADIAVWTLGHIYLTWKINQKKIQFKEIITSK